MSKENKTVVLARITFIVALIIMCAVCFFSFISKEQENEKIQFSNSDFTIKTEGKHKGNEYLTFEDKLTKTKIFYFKGAMVVLPAK